MTVWADEQEVETGLASYALDIGRRVLQYYGETFGLPYSHSNTQAQGGAARPEPQVSTAQIIPWSMPKMDMVSVPGKGGAMENWGLVLYGPDTLLYNKATNQISSANFCVVTKFQ